MKPIRGDIVDRSLHFYFLSRCGARVLVIENTVRIGYLDHTPLQAPTVICMMLLYFPHFPSGAAGFSLMGRSGPIVPTPASRFSRA